MQFGPRPLKSLKRLTSSGRFESPGDFGSRVRWLWLRSAPCSVRRSSGPLSAVRSRRAATWPRCKTARGPLAQSRSICTTRSAMFRTVHRMHPTDSESDPTDNGVWMTKAQLAAVRRIGPASADRLIRRQGWRKEPGNDGRARVFVPLTWAQSRGRRSYGRDWRQPYGQARSRSYGQSGEILRMSVGQSEP